MQVSLQRVRVTLQSTYLEDSSGIILIIGNAAITLAPLHHHRRLQSGIGHVRAAQVADASGVAVGGISVIFILHRSPFSIPEVEK